MRTMENKEVLKNLVSLANDLYSEGYACGISGIKSDAWFLAWAEAMRRVAAGEQYTSNLVIDIYNEQNGCD